MTTSEVIYEGDLDQLTITKHGAHKVVIERPFHTLHEIRNSANVAGYLVLTGSERPHVGHYPAFVGYNCIRCDRRIYAEDQCLPLITKEGTSVICDVCMLDAIVPLQSDPALPPERVDEAIEAMQKILCDSN